MKVQPSSTQGVVIADRSRIRLEFLGMHGEHRRRGMGRGVPSPVDYEVWESVMSSHSGVRGRAPAGNAFWRILKATERSFLYKADALSNLDLLLDILNMTKSEGDNLH